MDLIRFEPKLLLAYLSKMGVNPKLEALFDHNTRIGVTKGLEYRGLKTNLISRNINFNEPVVGDYDFVRYEGLVDEEDEVELVEYQSLCDKLAFYLNEKLDLGNGKLQICLTILTKQEFKQKDRHLYSLLMDLKNMGELTVNAFTNFESYQLLSEDFLMKAIYNKWLIDTQIITIYDNKKTLELNILELCDSTESVEELVRQSLDPYEYNVKLNYSIVKRCDLSTSPSDDNIIEWRDQDYSIPKELKELDLIIYKNDTNDSVDMKTLFQSVWDKLKENAFFQIIFREKFTESEKLVRKLTEQKCHSMDRNAVQSETEMLGFTYIGCNTNRFGAVAVLFRKITIDLMADKQVFIKIGHNLNNWLEPLKEEIKSIHNSADGQNIWLVSNDGPKSGILGLVHCMRKEINGLRIRSIFNFNDNKDIPLKDRQLIEQIIKKDLVFNVYKDNAWGYYKSNVRQSMAKVMPVQHCYLNNSNRGDLSSLKWFECQHKLWPIGRKDGQLLCYIYYSALNFRDIMLASGEHRIVLQLNMHEIRNSQGQNARSDMTEGKIELG